MTTPSSDSELDKTIIEFTMELMSGLNQSHFTKEQQAKIVLKAESRLLAWNKQRVEAARIDELGRHFTKGTTYYEERAAELTTRAESQGAE